MSMRIVFPLGLMIVIFVLSGIPMDGGPDTVKFLADLNPAVQNLLHIPLYGMLSMLWVHYFSGRGMSFQKAVLCGIAVSMGYGCLDEIHQVFVPGRYGGLMDMILNTVGAVAGAFAYQALVRICKSQRKGQ